jgi:signal transduction histidine kinase/DNA-binding response OmpR family regulator
MAALESQQNKPGVLIVDDTGANLVVLSAVLSPLGVRLVEAGTGAAALERLKHESFAVALLDVQMPGMDGFELAQRMRQMENGRELPIIFVTAIHRDERFVRRGYAIGAADYVTKPFDVEVLRARVKAFVDLFQQREEVRRVQVEMRTRERDEALRRVIAFERVATATLETNDLKTLLDELLGIFMGGAEHADFVRVFLRAGEELHSAAQTGRGELPPAARSYAIREDSLQGAIALSAKSLKLPANEPIVEARSSARTQSHEQEQRWLKGSGARAVIGVPLMNGAELLGICYTGTRSAPALTEREERLFAAVAERIAWAITKHTERARLESVLTGAPAMIAIFRGRDHLIDYLNPSFRAFLGPGEHQGKLAREIGLEGAITALLDGVFLSGQELTCEELPLAPGESGVPGRSGPVFLNLTAQPMRNPVGFIDGVTLFAVEVTAQVRARQLIERHQAERGVLLERERAARAEAEQANRAKDEFLATLSHELRTPLNAVIGWASRARYKSGADLERALGIIARNAEAQARIVDDMLDLSRIVNGKLRLELRTMRIQEPVRAAAEALRPAADLKHIGLEVSVDASLEANADPDRLQQIISNLVSNAIKFTPEGGQVRVHGRSAGANSLITVGDTGQGIEAEFLPNVFTPFRQADGSATRRHGGLGLGLAIAKQLAEAHGGRLQAESAGPGQGSLFSLILPPCNGQLSAEDLASNDNCQVARNLTREPVRLDHVKVLVVDDESDARTLVSEVLADMGAEVKTAESAAEAMNCLRTFRAVVLVSDIAMPGADGYQLMRQIRALAPGDGGDIKALALTAYARREDVERALAAGFERHMTKPVDMEKLTAAVAELAGPRP